MSAVINSSAKQSSFKFHITFKNVDVSEDDDWIIEGYATTPDLDRDNEVIDEKAVTDSLTRFMTNPIILYQHDHNEPIGTILEAKYDRKGLKIKAKISKTEQKIWTKIKEGILRAFSISALVIDTVWDKVKKLTRITKMDILEVSIVSVPANPVSLFSAVSKAVKSIQSDLKMTEEDQITEEKPTQEEQVSQAMENLSKKVESLEAQLAEKQDVPSEPEKKSFTDDELEQLIEKRIKEKMDNLPKKKALDSLATQDNIPPTDQPQKSELHIVKQMMLMNDGVDPDNLEESIWS